MFNDKYTFLTFTWQALVSLKKIYAPSSSLLQGKYLPFSPSPLCLNICRLFVILLLTQLYHYTPEISLFSTVTFKYPYRGPLRRIGQEYSAKVAFKNQMSVIWSWTYFYNLHWNNYLYFKGLLYIWEEMIMMALVHMAGLENSECIWKSDFRLIFLSNSSEGGLVFIFKCGSRKGKYLGSVTI